MVCCLRLRFCEDGGDDCDELSVILSRRNRCGLLSQLVNAKQDQIKGVEFGIASIEVAMSLPMTFERAVPGCTLLKSLKLFSSLISQIQGFWIL